MKNDLLKKINAVILLKEELGEEDTGVT